MPQTPEARLLYAQPVKRRQAEITDLDTALERIRQLEEALGVGFCLNPRFGLTQQEETMLGLLYRRNTVVTRQQAYDVLFGMHTDPPFHKILDVLMSHIRRKLRPLDVRFTTVWGRGWYLEPAERAKLDPFIFKSESEIAQ